jgi:hypothetical protein
MSCLKHIKPSLIRSNFLLVGVFRISEQQKQMENSVMSVVVMEIKTITVIPSFENYKRLYIYSSVVITTNITVLININDV